MSRKYLDLYVDETHAECSKCHEVKPRAAFDKEKRYPRGVVTKCKACLKADRGKSGRIRIDRAPWLNDAPLDDVLAIRFWPFVDKSGGEDACWPWRKGRFSLPPHDYGCVRLEPRPALAYVASRVAYAAANGGPLRDETDQFVCHRCDNPPCCNPAHLFLGSPTDNAQDMVSKRRHAYGDKHPNAELSNADVIEIRAALDKGETAANLARAYGVSYSLIWFIKHGKQRKAG